MISLFALTHGHMEHLHTIPFERDRFNGESVQMFVQATMNDLGKVVGRVHVHPVQAKVESIMALPVPKMRTEQCLVITWAFVKTFLPWFLTLTNVLVPTI